MKTVTDAYIAKEEDSHRKPLELYKIWHGTTYYYHTNGDVAVTFDSQTYTPATIKRTSIQYDSDLDANTLRVQFSRALDPLSKYIASNPVEIVWVEVSRLFRDQSPLEKSVIFFGQIQSTATKGAALKVRCVGFEFFLKQPVPTLRYQPQCNWTVFDTKCAKSSTGFTVTANSVTVSSEGLEITHANFGTKADHYFKMGDLVWGDYHRLITYHIGTLIKIRYPVEGLVTGENVTVYAGCEGSITMCYEKFDNKDNFGGHPYIPRDNPTLWMN